MFILINAVVFKIPSHLKIRECLIGLDLSSLPCFISAEKLIHTSYTRENLWNFPGACGEINSNTNRIESNRLNYTIRFDRKIEFMSSISVRTIRSSKFVRLRFEISVQCLTSH
jgi:hypothetical protein